jgi:hypothetical protein
MAELTKNDVKEAVSEVLAPFAVAIQKDFSDLRMEMREGLIKVHDDIVWTHGSLDVLRKEIAEIKENLKNVIYRHEFESLKNRISEIEKKVGIKK